MTEKRFLSVLRANLGRGISESEKRDILFDYEEHFRIGRTAGKSEEAIAASLGDPAILAKTIRVEVLADRAERSSGFGNVTRMVIASLSLGFFNIIFILGPYVALLGVLISLWATAASLALSGAVSVLAALFEPVVRFFVQYTYTGDIWMRIGVFFAGTLLFSLGSLGCIGMVQVTSIFFRGTVSYIRFNRKIITK